MLGSRSPSAEGPPLHGARSAPHRRIQARRGRRCGGSPRQHGRRSHGSAACRGSWGRGRAGTAAPSPALGPRSNRPGTCEDEGECPGGPSHPSYPIPPSHLIHPMPCHAMPSYPISFHPSHHIPSHYPIQSHPIISHPTVPSHHIPPHHIPSYPIPPSHPIPSHPIIPHTIISHPIPSNFIYPIPSHPIPCMPCHAVHPLPSVQAHLSQCRPAVWSRQRRQLPVWGSHSSACPLQWQGRQAGKPQWPGWHWSHCRPTAPGWHRHCPLTTSHSCDTEPSGEQAQAAGWHSSGQAHGCRDTGTDRKTDRQMGDQHPGHAQPRATAQEGSCGHTGGQTDRRTDR